MQNLTSAFVAYEINALWEIPLLVLAAEATARLLDRSRAAVIHRIWVGCLIMTVLLPALSLVRPPAHRLEFKSSKVGMTVAEQSQALPSSSQKVEKQASLGDQPPSRTLYGSQSTPRVESIQPHLGSSQIWLKWIGVLFLVSAFISFVMLAWSTFRTLRLLRSAKPAQLRTELREAWESCLQAFGLSRVEILSSPKLSSPATLTLYRPMVILPADFEEVTASELKAAFCHELAHICRKDFLFNLLQRAIATPLLFHPAMIWILRRLADTRELACDDMAADAMAGPRVYADNLLRLAQRMCSADPQPTYALGVFETELMEKRVMNLIGQKAKQTWLCVAGSVVMSTGLLAGICAAADVFGFHPVLAEVANQANHAPKGWWLTSGTPANYHTGVDKEMVHNGLPSAYLTSDVQGNGGFGSLMQNVSSVNYAGKRIRMRAWVRSENVSDWAGLWMRIDKKTGMVSIDNMQNRPIRGTRQWTSYDVVLDVPEDATNVAFGILLQGRGKVWLNNVQLNVVGKDVATTDIKYDPAPASPVNLGFQQ